MAILRDILMVVTSILSIMLIVIVMSQTTKSEGLSGGAGGQVTSNFKGKPGMDEQLRTYTIYISIAWFVLSVITAIVTSRM